MGFKLVMLPPQTEITRGWARRLATALPEIAVVMAEGVQQAQHDIVDADAAFGVLPLDLLQRAHKLRWLQANQAAPPAGGVWTRGEQAPLPPRQQPAPPSPQPVQESVGGGLLGTIGGMLGGIFGGGSSGPQGGRQRMSTGELIGRSMAQSAARSIGTQITRAIMRNVLGGLQK